MARHHCTGLLLLALALLLGAAGSAAAEDAVAVRAGDHLGFGRLVFDFTDLVEYRLHRVGESVVLDFADPASIGRPPFLPRNVVAFTGADGAASVGVAPGAALRMMRIGTRIVLDVLDPRPEATEAAPAGPRIRVAANDLPLPLPPPPIPLPPLPGGAAITAPSAQEGMALPAPPVIAAERPRPAAAPAAPTPASPLLANGEAGPDLADLDGLALAASRVGAPDGALAAILLPFGHDSGAASFRRGNAGYVVFDESRPIDMASLAGDPDFGAARVTLLPAGTLLRVPLPPTLDLTLRHREAGWVVGITAAAPGTSAIVSEAASGTFTMPLPTAARVVVMPDPETGADLLVGTLHVPGAAVAVSRHFPGFVLLPTWLGVVVEPQSDHLVLDAGADGLTLRTDAPGGLPLSPEPAHVAALENAATLTRRFDFPAIPLGALAVRLGQELDEAVAAPRLARFAPRLAEAKTMLALGMGPEAEALIRLAVTDDPRHEDDPDVHGLAAIAALLAGRIDQSGGLADPVLSGSDEIALWRAARAALRGEDAAGTAPVFAATCPLILAYPEALRDFLAPIAAEAMVKGGELRVASEFLAEAPDDPPLALARAGLLAAEGKTAAALTAYQSLAFSPDRPVAAWAASRAVLLRLASGAIGKIAAADALSRQFYAWRGGAHELGLRLKVAELRADAGAWGQALDLLASTETLFPAEAARVRDARVATFERLFASHAADRLAPLALVSLIEDNADLIGTGAAGEKLGEMLADRLVALDLPDRAEPVLAKLMAAAPPGAPQAALGVRLAEIRLAGNDPAGALAALAQSRATDLPPPLAERRTLAYARAMAAEGHDGPALTALAAFADPAADALRAGLLQKEGNWAGAEDALAGLVAGEVPASGPLSDGDRRALVQLASTATEAGDAGRLAALGADYGPRMGEGPLADMFRLLTDPPARNLGDLPRVARETTIAEQLPDELKAIGAAMQILP